MREGLSRRTAAGLLAVLLILLLGAWWTGITRRFFDYDEIYHAHASWLIWQGDIPYKDFLACHTPFAWYLLATLWYVLPESPSALIILRTISALGVAVWLVAMAENFRLHRAEISRGWICLGLLLVLSTSTVIDFALEFRPDAWCYALLFLALLVFRLGRPASVPARYALFSFLACAAVIANPKCVLLAAFFVPFELWTTRSTTPLLRAGMGLAAGAAAAALVGWLFLKFAGIDSAATHAFGIRYQALFEARTGFHYGLLRSLLARPLLLGLTVSGMLAWGIYLKRHGIAPQGFELAIVLFLLVQLVVAQRPYKQYYAPWLLTAAGFTPYLGLCFRPSRPIVGFAAVAAIAAVCSLNSLMLFAQHNGARSLLRYYQSMLDLTDSSSKVVAWLPLHPIMRRDAFYGWNRTTDPVGYTTESIVRDMGLPQYTRKFEEPDYWRQLEASPPALIVSSVPLTSSYEPVQARVLEKFLQKHQAEYILIDQGLLCPVWLRHFEVPSTFAEPATRQLTSHVDPNGDISGQLANPDNE